VSNPYKSLGGQALIYGLGNIVPRMLNYAVLTVYYTRRFPPEEYGVITELYAYVAIFLVVLTYGMETGLFRFSSNGNDKQTAFTSILTLVTSTSLIFALLIWLLNRQISGMVGYAGNPEYIVYLGFTLSFDAIGSILFAKLRIENKVKRFALLKIINVVTTVFFVFLFLEIIPLVDRIAESHFYQEYMKHIEVGYVFIANLLSSFILLLLLVRDLKGIRFSFNSVLLKDILRYSLPLLISGLAGIFNETIDRILLRRLLPEGSNALYELGIYGANYRIAVLMTIFVQMFRYAAEPFFFNLYGKHNSTRVYANILKYFTIFLMIIFLMVGLGIDFFKLFIDKDYYEGLGIVPVVLLANVMVGLLFNVNMWYKLSGNTMYGVYITGIGAIITVLLNILFIPLYGYFACAWIHLITNVVMLILTYYYGQRVYRIDYDVKRIGMYILSGIGLFIIGSYVRTNYVWLNLFTAVLLVSLYIWFCNKKENLIAIFLKKNEG
jgi:O-antigen/teichoic acid export membrane protein